MVWYQLPARQRFCEKVGSNARVGGSRTRHVGIRPRFFRPNLSILMSLKRHGIPTTRIMVRLVCRVQGWTALEIGVECARGSFSHSTNGLRFLRAIFAVHLSNKWYYAIASTCSNPKSCLIATIMKVNGNKERNLTISGQINSYKMHF